MKLYLVSTNDGENLYVLANGPEDAIRQWGEHWREAFGDDYDPNSADAIPDSVNLIAGENEIHLPRPRAMTPEEHAAKVARGDNPPPLQA